MQRYRCSSNMWKIKFPGSFSFLDRYLLFMHQKPKFVGKFLSRKVCEFFFVFGFQYVRNSVIFLKLFPTYLWECRKYGE